MQAGDFTTFVVLFGSFLRPIGGMLSDRLGGYRMLLVLLVGACLSILVVSTLPPLVLAVAALSLAMSCMGMGNGSVFQLVPQRFPDRVGIMTGLVGAAGGFGGFLLPSMLGFLKDQTGSFGIGMGSACLLLPYRRGGVVLPQRNLGAHVAACCRTACRPSARARQLCCKDVCRPPLTRLRRLRHFPNHQPFEPKRTARTVPCNAE